jgi:NifU-like protein involved in Fe-S cluster formation
MPEFSNLVQEYYTNPINNHRIDHATLSRHEGNSLCGDDITIYAMLSDEITPTTDCPSPSSRTITQRSYDGNVSMITQAAASFFSELVVGSSIDEIMTWTEQRFIGEGFDVSPRRRRARVIALLATRNAIHAWRGDGIVETFEDVLIEE